MNSRTELQITQMIGYAGSARSHYIKAIDAAADPEKFEKLIQDGDSCFDQAHRIHFNLLQENPEGIVEGMLLMIHAEDQMSAAETFRILARKFRDIQQN